MTKMQHALKPLGAFVAGCALALACVLGFASSAEAQTESVGWSVAYNADKQMVSDYDRAAIDEKLANLQPGDSFTMSVTLNNKYSDATDWYMTADAVKTLEEASSASNGAYTYKLIFDGRTIYSSDMLAIYAVGIIAAVACIAFSLVSLRKLHKGRDAQ